MGEFTEDFGRRPAALGRSSLGGTMKRTSATILLLAGLGGCTTPDKVATTNAAPTNVIAESPRPFGQAIRAQAGGGVKGSKLDQSAVRQASATDAPGTIDNMVKQTAGLGTVRVNGMGAACADGSCNTGSGGGSAGGGNGLPAYGPTTSGVRQLLGHGAGILPVPARGVDGAVAYPAGMGGPGSGMYAGMYAPGRTSIRFANPAGMKVTWQAAGGSFPESGLEAPSRYNFPQLSVYRLRLSGIPNRPGKNYYPTLEIYGATPKTITYLSHNTVPVAFTDEDFEQVNAGNLVIKVIYLPDEKYQDIAAVAGAEELVSTRLEPGVNPVEEANRKGTILAVVRIGNIDLQDPNIPPIDAPVPGSMPMMQPTPPMNARPATPSLMPTTPVPSLNPTTVPTPPATMPATLPSGLKPASLTTPVVTPSFSVKPVAMPK